MNHTILVCPICDYCCEDSNLRKLEIDCQFIEIDGVDQHLIRHQCSNCGVIFGTQQMLKLTRDQLKAAYQKVFATGYTDGDESSANKEISNLLALQPNKNGVYLNYGSGTSTASKKATAMGFNLIDYDPFVVNGGVNITKPLLYDGIISHNLMEHFQDPIGEMRIMKSLLKPNAVMIHSTPCYKYSYAFTKFHLFFFEGASLDIICQKVGLTHTYLDTQTVRYNQI